MSIFRIQQPTFVARRAHIILFLLSLFVSMVMAIDIAAFLWLQVVSSELDFLCYATPSAEQCGALTLDGYMNERVALLAAIMVLHASLIVSTYITMMSSFKLHSTILNIPS